MEGRHRRRRQARRAPRGRRRRHSRGHAAPDDSPARWPRDLSRVQGRCSALASRASSDDWSGDAIDRCWLLGPNSPHSAHVRLSPFHSRSYSMAMPVSRSNWTVDMLDELPDDGNKYELIDGELFVTPAPSDVHQLIAGALHARLRTYLRPGSVARAMISP